MQFMHKGSNYAFLNFISWYLSSKSDYVFKKEPWQEKIFANFISESSYLEDLNQDEEYEHIEMLQFNEEDYKKIDSQYLFPIIRLKKYVNENLREFLVDFLIHGSMSTLDYSMGWSDLDTLVIVKKEILRYPDKLINLRKHIMTILPELYAIDPLQHHQFIITTEKAILNSSYAILPSETIIHSKSLFGNETLKIAKNRQATNGEKNLLSVNNLFKNSLELGYMDHHKKNNIALENNFKNMNCMYQLKYFLSCLMIIPTYYLDAIGKSCYKRFSFKEFDSIISTESEILKKSSQIRQLWAKQEKHPYKSNIIPNWICDILGNDYFERAYDFSSKIADSIIEN